MELEQIQHKEEFKTARMQIRTTPSKSKWMKDNKVSPSLLFDVALTEFMEKNK